MAIGEKRHKEAPYLKSDIDCLEKNSHPCDLNFESYLLQKGYPKFSGAPKWRGQLIKELNEYQEEQTKELESVHEEITILEKDYNQSLEKIKATASYAKKIINSETRLNFDQIKEQLETCMNSHCPE